MPEIFGYVGLWRVRWYRVILGITPIEQQKAPGVSSGGYGGIGGPLRRLPRPAVCGS